MKNKYIISVMLSCFVILSAQAQESVAASGGSVNDSSGALSFTVGSIAHNTMSSDAGMVVSGVLQPYEISQLTSLEQQKAFGVVCKVFPNPTTQYLTLQLASNRTNSGSFKASVFKVDGSLIQTFQVFNDEAKIEMGNYKQGTYILKILDETSSSDQSISTFKIIKN